MQHRITQSGPLHRPDGTLAEPGWATAPLLMYDRSRIRAPRWRIKEWDYYCILADSFGLACTVADNGYMGFASVTLFDFVARTEHTHAVMSAFPLGSFSMPPSSRTGDVTFSRPGLSIFAARSPGLRRLVLRCPSLGGRELSAELELEQDDRQESMVIATPFAKNRHAFYYNEKINCLRARGAVHWGGRTLDFLPNQAFGVLDWGRGVWTYANTWYWGSASGLVDGVPFGFNIGYGFGDTSRATENMLFFEGRAHKLDQVTFHIPEPDFLSPWRFSSNDGRFELDFVPILDRHSHDNFVILKSLQHQVFGRFSGRVILDDGRALQLKDFLGFAEKVVNRW